MTDITVIRGEGDWPGQDIVDPLLATDAVALARGQAELNNGNTASEVNLRIPLTDVRLGNLIEVNDQVLGIFRAKCTAVAHKLEINEEGQVNCTTELTLRRP